MRRNFQSLYLLLQIINLFLLAILLVSEVFAQSGSFERQPIDYLNAPVSDPVAKLAAKVEAGELELAFDQEHGYLKAVLAALNVPISSQTLVFSKTSLQLQRISPGHPRALYFNDDVYVGFCQRGDVLEFAATDAQQGAIFYTLEQSTDTSPKFIRDRGQCLTCHASSRTQNVPGYLVRSVFPDYSGHPILGSGTFTTDHTSPLEERWGGWYVTGQHGSMRHMGNAICGRDEKLDREAGANLQSLDGIVSTKPYLSTHSDLVALMVLEHQTQMHNAIASANYETRQALHQSSQMNELLGRDAGYVSESAERRIQSVTERVVEYLLMKNEFHLTAPVSGTSGFAEEFAKRGIRDSQARSLRELDLQTRVFKYPCSYLIHSPAFAGLPEEVRQPVLRRVHEILDGQDESGEYEYLTEQTRREIWEILQATLPEFGKLCSR